MIAAFMFVPTKAGFPTLTLSPAGCCQSGGQLVTITASGGLSGTTSVSFGSTPAVYFTVVSSTQINAMAPAEWSTSPGAVTLTLSGGSTATYTYDAAPLGDNFNSITLASSNPTRVRSGPDGLAVWVADINGGKVWKIVVASGSTSSVTLTHSGQNARNYDLCVGADGNVYVVDQFNVGLWQVVPSVSNTFYSIGSGQTLAGVCLASDGNLYVVDQGMAGFGAVIWKVTPGGSVSSFVSWVGGAQPNAICFNWATSTFWIADLNGFAWHTPLSSPTLTSVTLSGASAFDICIGPDGNAWVADQNQGVWKVTSGGSASLYSAGQPDGICLGPDGNLWAADPAGPSLWQVTPTGTATQINTPSRSASPYGICGGPDCNIWFVDENGGAVVAYGTNNGCAIPCSANPLPGSVTATISGGGYTGSASLTWSESTGQWGGAITLTGASCHGDVLTFDLFYVAAMANTFELGVAVGACSTFIPGGGTGGTQLATSVSCGGRTITFVNLLGSGSTVTITW